VHASSYEDFIFKIKRIREKVSFLEHNIREYYLMVISGALTMFTGGLIWPIYAPFIREEFTAPLFLTGIAVSGYFILRMLSEFPIGVLSDKVGPKTPLMIGRILAIIGAVLCFSTRNIWVLIFARSIWGAGDASFFCVGMSYVTRLFTSEKRGRALGAFQAVEMIGNFSGQTIGGLVASMYGTRFNFLIATVFGLIVLGLVGFLKGITIQNQDISKLLPSRDDFLLILNWTVIAACFINLISMMINTGLLGTIFPIYATEILLISLFSYGLLVSGSTVGSIAGNLLGGFLSDRMGRKKVLIFGFLIGAFAIFNLGIFTGFSSLLILMLLKGIFWGILYGVTPAYIADTVPDSVRGKAIGTFRTFMDLGGVIGPILMTTLVQNIGVPKGYNQAFTFSAGLIIISFALVFKLRDT
jgi:MFS family permease